MPNTGKPSRNCHLCRARRVKCDLTQPTCRRCVTYGAECPGYRKEIDLMFHHEDPSSPTRTKRRAARPRSTPTPLSSPSIKSEEGSRLSSPSLVLELSETKQNVSVCLLLDRFSAVLLDGPALGFLSCLPGLYADVPPDHCIVQATEALAYAHLAQEPRGRPSERSKWMYATALKSTNMALSSPRTAADDTTIAAVLFLAIYELLCSYPPYDIQPGSNAWHKHTMGIASLIQIRGPGQFRTRCGRNLFWATFGHIVVRCIDAGDPCPAASRRWLADMAAHMDDEHRGPHAAYSFLVDISKFLPSVIRKTQEGDATAALAALPVVLRDLQAADISEKGLNLLDRFYTQGYIHNICRAVRARVHSAVGELIDLASTAAMTGPWLGDMLRDKRAASEKVVSRMVQEMLDNLAVFGEGDPSDGGGITTLLTTLCWGDTLKNLWSVFHIAQLDGLPGPLSEQARALLVQVCREVGIERALHEAEAGGRGNGLESQIFDMDATCLAVDARMLDGPTTGREVS